MGHETTGHRRILKNVSKLWQEEEIGGTIVVQKVRKGQDKAVLTG